ncbi:hypothetical protein DCC85_09640 [Paenibacillus sp. CAA11]|uniref:hypothetical protein n=1 Tax=Paenibacillus sp. CAA11 TaxID=1532905 RepID=UPI000D37BAAC|nr:hypothetical protein [Paenibacillus sp. CAA11]AWB44461.1 hypothetical protein DCC85_09640 [Paenibacillus sp. CAA11]
MPTQDPKELLNNKHKMDQQKAEFANFVRSVSDDAPPEPSQQFAAQDRGEPDQQNQLKDQENRQI